VAFPVVLRNLDVSVNYPSIVENETSLECLISLMGQWYLCGIKRNAKLKHMMFVVKKLTMKIAVSMC
jgi:hypothetical protein